METLDCIKARKSVRKFSSKEISQPVLYSIFESATYAPSAGNTQNTRFIVIEDEETKKLIAGAALEQEFIADAPVVVVVCSVNEGLKREYDERGEKLYSHQGAAAAIENMLLAATDLGVGSCWIGAFTEAEIRMALRIPDDISVEAIIPLGYSEDDERRPHKADPADSFFFGAWGDSKRAKDIFPLGNVAVEACRKKAKQVIGEIIERAKRRHHAVQKGIRPKL